MRKHAWFPMVLALVASFFLPIPEAQACDAQICEEVTGCYGCVWYGVLFTDCFLGGCNSCATKRCDSLAQDFGAQSERLADVQSLQSSGDSEGARCAPSDPDPIAEEGTVILTAEVLPDRT